MTSVIHSKCTTWGAPWAGTSRVRAWGHKEGRSHIPPSERSVHWEKHTQRMTSGAEGIRATGLPGWVKKISQTEALGLDNFRQKN